MVVDSANAEPVGLFFAGGSDAQGVEHAIASPVGDVLRALDGHVPGSNGPTAYSLVGGADHPVACLRYRGKNAGVPEAQPLSSLSQAERERATAALPQAQALVNPRSGITRVGIASSNDHPGEAAIALYVGSGTTNVAPNNLPVSVGGVETVISTKGDEAKGDAEADVAVRASSFAAVLAAKQSFAASLLRDYPSIFGVGVGQSLDSPREAALMLFADRRKGLANLPRSVAGQRVRVVLMDRPHVTRSHDRPAHAAGSCFSPRSVASPEAVPFLLDRTPFRD